MLDAARITELLPPFFGDTIVPAELPAQLQTYLELLLRWNAHINLTAVRDPEQVVTRHFGESLFAARTLLELDAFRGTSPSVADVGSGAGFPGLPIKLLVPHVHLTLIESHNKKATFLREVIRALNLQNAEVFPGRAETWGRTATVVTLRAVEKFDQALPVAAALVASQGMLCTLIGSSQADSVREWLGASWQVQSCVGIPLSEGRVALVGRRPSKLV